MKNFLKIAYVVFAIYLSVAFYNGAQNKKLITYYENEALTHLENNDFNSYFDVFFRSTGITTEYNTEPLYNASYHNENFNYQFYIMETRLDNEFIYWFYLNESNDYSTLLNETEIKVYNQPYTNKSIQIKMTVDGSDDLIINNLQLTNSLTYRQPLALLKSDGIDFYYISSDSKSREYKKTKEITSISISYNLTNKNIDEPISKELISINSNRNNNNGLDNLTTDNSLLTSNTFNGFIDSFISVDKNYVIISHDEINAYNYVAKNFLFKYFLALFIATYIIFFLTPTLDLIKIISDKGKDKKFNKKSSNKNQIFKDE